MVFDHNPRWRTSINGPRTPAAAWSCFGAFRARGGMVYNLPSTAAGSRSELSARRGRVMILEQAPGIDRIVRDAVLACFANHHTINEEAGI